jgi:hypothetical protein
VSLATVQHPGDGKPEQSASHVGENLIIAKPSDRIDLCAPLLLHIPGGEVARATLQPTP